MHYYKFNIPEWALHTSHLTLEEEAIYFRLINYYYDKEGPIPLDLKLVLRRLRVVSKPNIVEQILSEFFIKTEKGFEHKYCEQILKEYRKTAKKNKANGAKGGRPKKHAASSETQKKPTGLSVGSQTEPKHNPNYKLLTINQELKTNSNNKKHMSNKFDDSVQEIFTYWLNVMNKGSNTKLTKKRRDKIQTRLGEGYTVDDIKQAITNCAKSDFHMGRNGNSTIYNDLELICREGSKLEHFMHNVGQQAPPKQYGDHVERTFQNLEGVNLDDL